MVLLLPGDHGAEVLLAVASVVGAVAEVLVRMGVAVFSADDAAVARAGGGGLASFGAQFRVPGEPAAAALHVAPHRRA